MDAADQLLTIAEISVALAGFAGIIATFQFGRQTHVSRGYALSLSLVIIISMAAIVCSVLPLALINFGFEGPSIWSISSFVGGLFWLTGSIFTFRNMSVRNFSLANRMLFVALLTLAVVSSIANFLNAFGIVFDQEYGPYFAAFLFGFFLVLFNFSRILLIPVWAGVNQRKAVNPGAD